MTLCRTRLQRPATQDSKDGHAADVREIGETLTQKKPERKRRHFSIYLKFFYKMTRLLYYNCIMIENSLLFSFLHVKIYCSILHETRRNFFSEKISAARRNARRGRSDNKKSAVRGTALLKISNREFFFARRRRPDGRPRVVPVATKEAAGIDSGAKGFLPPQKTNDS